MWTIFYSEVGIFLAVFLAILIFLLIGFRKERKKRRKVLTFYGIASVILIIVFLLNGYGVKYYDVVTADSKLYSEKELQEDFDVLEDAICNQNPLVFVDQSELKKSFQEVRDQINHAMTQEEFYRLVNPLVVEAKCGHTNLSVSQALIENRTGKALYFPLEVKIQNNQIIVAKSYSQYDIQEGDIIRSINGNDADSIISCFYKNISHDGDNLAIAAYIASKHFGYEYFEFIEKAVSFLTMLEDADGNSYSVALDGEYIDACNTASWQLHMEEYSEVTYYDYKIEDETAFLTVRVFFEGKEKFASFLADFFKQVKEEKIENLVIDIRGNFGGSPQMSRELLSYLISEHTPYFSSKTKLPLLYRMQGLGKEITPKENHFTGNITLLIDGGVFSTAGHFAAVFQSNHLGTVEGEPTGGGYACTDGSKNITLKNTGIRLHCSQTYYEVVADENYKNSVFP